LINLCHVLGTVTTIEPEESRWNDFKRRRGENSSPPDSTIETSRVPINDYSFFEIIFFCEYTGIIGILYYITRKQARDLNGTIRFHLQINIPSVVFTRGHGKKFLVPIQFYCNVHIIHFTISIFALCLSYFFRLKSNTFSIFIRNNFGFYKRAPRVFENENIWFTFVSKYRTLKSEVFEDLSFFCRFYSMETLIFRKNFWTFNTSVTKYRCYIYFVIKK